MKKVMLLGALFVGSFAVNAQTYTVDAVHSNLGFVITHLKISEMMGEFKKFDVKITSAKEDFSDAVIEMTADANSINTGNEGRDKHLASPDFLNAEKNPTISFKSTKMTKVKGTMYKVTGDLTMNGVTKSVELNANYKGKTKGQKDVYVWKVTGKIKRSDFGVGATMPNEMVDDIITLNANLEFSK